jgi:hypothetical protein
MPRTHHATAPSPRTRLRRAADLAAYDAATIHAILDAGPVAHVGYVIDGAPVVNPTLQWREGGRVYWHGSAASRMLRAIAGAPVCLTVTLTDGLVLARSGLDHTVAYRSVMLFGRAERIAASAEKARTLRVFTERHFPGRWDSLRPMTAQELKATAILSMPIDEASAKVSPLAMPDEPAADRAWPVWAGVIPLSSVAGEPVPAPDLAPGLPLPGYLVNWRFGG